MTDQPGWATGENAMKVPKQFKQLVAGFYQGSDRLYAGQDEWIKSTLFSFTTGEDRKIIKRFLDQLLDGDHTHDMLQDVWRSGNPCYFLHGDDLKSFLLIIRSKIE